MPSHSRGALTLLAIGASTFAFQAMPNLRLTRELAISGSLHDFTTDYGDRPAAVSRDGRMFVINEPDARYLVFDSAGKRVGIVGGRGAGPGEFARSAVFRLLPGFRGDTLVVYDPSTRRFVLFDQDLRFKRQFTLPRYDPELLARFSPMALLSDGRVIGVAEGLLSGRPSSGGTTKRVSDSAIVIMGPTGQVERRLIMLPADSALLFTAPIRFPFAVPFRQRALRGVSPDGSLAAAVTARVSSSRGGDFRVILVGERGDTLFTRGHQFVSAPVTRAMADSAYEAAAKPRPSGRGDVTLDRSQLEFLRRAIPRATAPFDRILVGSDSSVWLQRAVEGSPTHIKWLVLDVKGKARGEVTVSAAERVIAASGGFVWTLYTADDGVSSVVRYRLGE